MSLARGSGGLSISESVWLKAPGSVSSLLVVLLLIKHILAGGALRLLVYSAAALQHVRETGVAGSDRREKERD